MAINPPAGWYSDPELVDTERFWNGSKWMDSTRRAPSSARVGGEPEPAWGQLPPVPPAAGLHRNSNEQAGSPRLGQILIWALLVAAVYLAIKPVSLLSGDDTAYFAVVCTAAAVLTSYLTKRGRVLLVITIIAAGLCVANVVYDEHQLSHRRSELQQIFQGPK